MSILAFVEGGEIQFVKGGRSLLQHKRGYRYSIYIRCGGREGVYIKTVVSLNVLDSLVLVILILPFSLVLHQHTFTWI